jgi:hypothetical protein
MLEHLRICSPACQLLEPGDRRQRTVDRVRSTPPAGPPQLPFFRSRTQEDPPGPLSKAAAMIKIKYASRTAWRRS